MSKINVGVYGFTNTLSALVKMAPEAILLCDPPIDYYKQIRVSLPPETFVVLRRYIPADQQTAALAGPEEGAQKIADHYLELALSMPGVNAVMSLNEPPANTPEDFERYEIFQLEFLRIVQEEAGISVCAGNFGVGNPQVASAFKPYDPNNNSLIMYMRRSTTTAHYLGIHPYGPPGTTPMDDPALSPWYNLRHRLMMKDFAMAGIKSGEIIATEAGVYDQAGWKHFLREDEYFRQLVWQTEQMAKDNLMGPMVFGLFGNGQWSGFDLMGTGMVDRIAAYNKQVK